MFINQKLSIVKIAIFPKGIYRFNIIPIDIQQASFNRCWQPNSIIFIKMQRTENNQNNFEKEH